VNAGRTVQHDIGQPHADDLRFCRSKAAKDNGPMVPTHIQLANSMLRRVIKRLQFPLEIMLL
jgi:hypothetical protein